LQEKYEEVIPNLDKNNNGVPDAFEAKNSADENNNEAMFNVFGDMAPFQSMSVTNSTKYVVNG